jgi:DnaK suppressor protein
MPASRPARPDAGGADHVNNDADQSVRLHDELDRATEHLAALQGQYDELLADPDVIQEDRDATALLLEHARTHLEAARLAVERLDEGNYGRCSVCGGEIGDERLAALVDVTTCVRCAG